MRVWTGVKNLLTVSLFLVTSGSAAMHDINSQGEGAQEVLYMEMAGLPFWEEVRGDNMLYLSGQRVLISSAKLRFQEA